MMKKGRYVVAAVLSGALIPLMIMLNGELSEKVGNYVATVYIHAVGLLAVALTLIMTKRSPHPGQRLPLLMYLGGAVGVICVVATNYAYQALGVAIPLALGLLGQLLASLLVDQLGLFGMPKRPLRPLRLLSLGIVAVGITLMLCS